MIEFHMGGVEDENPENMEDLYASRQSCGTKGEYDIPFPDWKVVDEYQDPVEPNSSSDNFAVVFLEVENLINSCV